jgi:hypothetical protein
MARQSKNRLNCNLVLDCFSAVRARQELPGRLMLNAMEIFGDCRVMVGGCPAKTEMKDSHHALR